MVEFFQIGSGWGHVGNGVVYPPKLRVFAVGTVPVLMLSIHLDSRTELWGKCCRCSQPNRMTFREGHSSKGIFSAGLLKSDGSWW